MARILALYVLPDGTCERIELTGDGDRQAAQLADMVEGPLQHWPLGRHLTVHTGAAPFRRTRNQPLCAAWHSLAGGSPAPDLRGPTVVTGPADRHGVLQPLPPAAADLVERWAGLLRTATIRVRPDISAAQLRGTREVQCDAHAVYHDRASGRWGFAVLDGIDDWDEVRDYVREWAPRLARAAAELGQAANGIAHTRHQVNSDGGHWDLGGEAVAVAAVWDPATSTVSVGWSGDARAYRLSRIGALHQLTSDHNEAQDKRNVGLEPGPWDHNTVTAHLEYGRVGHVEVHTDQVAQLILCSDGVYHPLEESEPGLMEEAAVLALDATDSAASLVHEAVVLALAREERSDNATALVVTFPHPL